MASIRDRFQHLGAVVAAKAKCVHLQATPFPVDPASDLEQFRARGANRLVQLCSAQHLCAEQ